MNDILSNLNVANGATALETNKKTDEDLNPVEKCLKAYFDAEAERDPQFAVKWATTTKTVHDAFKYLYDLHRKDSNGGCAASDNDADNALAKQFIMDDNIKVNVPKSAPVQTNAKEVGSIIVEAKTGDKTETLGAVVLPKTPTKSKSKTKPASSATAAPKMSEKNIFDFAVEEGIDIFKI